MRQKLGQGAGRGMRCGEGSEQVNDVLCQETRGPKRGKDFEGCFRGTLGAKM